ncbi:LacI family DNA-binding transcriptional regulator [Streptomyces fuscichromogenes]|uniref:LacI family DNA-binding transcriptional regulator n=1 Tax=Streptomyces fuscichromogenes TaxID=1324013 RepID=UPI00382A8BDD
MCDTAQAAGVSCQTVSRVIDNHPNVREATYKRVEAAIAALGSRRNATACAQAGGVPRSVTALTSNAAVCGYAAHLQVQKEATRAAAHRLGETIDAYRRSPGGTDRCSPARTWRASPASRRAPSPTS